ncbi:UDP-N-acetylmuramoyl-tripeptide--D-alanyl-D-alanine ligase [Corynebacterium heidelbergense]|uniref:UDP-N-acetylmuramoyl-tripeptide--D-alanyl-D-alanine ligase n=1 Tax=Corynebacterium heidelbergense TaxID=2055947 RepID=A0A364V6H5_9CORY|nr:UDP-N-acetylmuramoyl-tripeptide--D-alanyl-D-alanine ligase [Corynebacterium heidelbergense]RAV32260.1 UDP-N-acetylmuramoyl-tripeptide--D-alanyl-D-alanine ligase [Corynebacterium heidelbergense]
MIELTVGDIATITGGGHLTGGIDPQATVTGPVEFDSRRITPGSIFMALPGAHVDGHDFAADALKKGAALLLLAKDVNLPALIVPRAEMAEDAANATAFEFDYEGHGASILAAVDKLARYNTDELVRTNGMLVVGVTGSAGKTSSKDLIGAVLQMVGETIAPPGSFNNEIGLPYTALRAVPSTKFLVAEMSARGQGHIRHLTEVVPPRFGVVLNVGSAHLGEFGSREAIARAKSELIQALPADGVAVLNADDDKVRAMAELTDAKVVTFSAAAADGADYYATDIVLDEVARASFTLHHPAGDPQRIELGVFGAHQVSNALAAAAVGIEAGVPPQLVAQALGEHVAASENRMDVRRTREGVTIINDSYNANPESMRAGVDALAYTATGRADAQSWAVLGQMSELGEDAVAAHTDLGALLGRRRIDNVVVVGSGVNQRALAASARQEGVETHMVEDIDAAVNFLDQNLRPNDVVLIKASYSDGLWGIARGLLADGQ